MAIDNVSLIAQAAYSKVNTQPKIAENEMKNAVNFQKMVNVQFNNFAKMSPEQILNHIKNVQGSNSNSPVANNGIAESFIKSIRNKVISQDNIVRKSLLNEASFIDLLTTTKEAEHTLKTLVNVRDKLVDAHDRIMNMAV